MRSFVSPPFEGETETVVFIERSIGEAGHSVIPVVTTTPTADVRAVEDHACMILDGAHSKFVHQPKMDRSIVFGGCKNRQLSLQELAAVFQFISQNGLYSGEDCAAHSLWFARTCVAALKVAMHGSHHCLTPPRGEAAIKVDTICQKAVDLFIRKTFSGYPMQKIAEENRLRQLDALCEEERTKRKLEIERWRKREDDRAKVIKLTREILKTRYGCES